MAKFRNSTVEIDAVGNQDVGVHAASMSNGGERDQVIDRSIGDIIAELRNLTAEQVEQILVRQREKGIRFGEAAVDLGFASHDDILFALSQQFHYPYSPSAQSEISPELVALSQPFSPRAERFRALRSQLMMRLFPETESRRAVAFISADRGDGKTYCVSNLAVTIAQLGCRTLLVDADMRAPRLHEVFNLPNGSGLSGILSGRNDGHVIHQVAGVPSLFVLPVGITPPNPLELVERPAFGLLMRELASKFDYILVDTPAASHGADASVIAARCGACLLVARKNSSQFDAMQDLVYSFEGSNARLAGFVLNEF